MSILGSVSHWNRWRLLLIGLLLCGVWIKSSNSSSSCLWNGQMGFVFPLQWWFCEQHCFGRDILILAVVVASKRMHQPNPTRIEIRICCSKTSRRWRKLMWFGGCWSIQFKNTSLLLLASSVVEDNVGGLISVAATTMTRGIIIHWAIHRVRWNRFITGTWCATTRWNDDFFINNGVLSDLVICLLISCCCSSNLLKKHIQRNRI